MRTTLYKILCILLCALFTLAVYAQDKPAGIVGEWNYTAAGAPSGYDTGVLKIKSENGKLTGEAVMSGQAVKINEIRKEGEAYKCTVYVDGYPVNVILRQKGDGLEGSSEVDGDVNPITFKRVVKK